MLLAFEIFPKLNKCVPLGFTNPMTIAAFDLLSIWLRMKFLTGGDIVTSLSAIELVAEVAAVLVPE